MAKKKSKNKQEYTYADYSLGVYTPPLEITTRADLVQIKNVTFPFRTGEFNNGWFKGSYKENK